LKKERVAVLGSTGIVGQAFLWMLSGHKLFEPSFISASSSRSGKSYGDEVKWVFPYQMPETVKNMRIENLDYFKLKELGIRIVFSALPSDVARTIEPDLRENGFLVFSNAGAMRDEVNVPILIPEINLCMMNLIKLQGFPGKGFIVANANCAATGIAVALAPLKKFGIRELYLSTYQSISGAGYPGLSALDISVNAIPYIKDEEEKISNELKKILVIDAEIYPHCVRIPTLFGHLETVWVKLEKSVKEDEIIEAWKTFGLKNVDLPSAPDAPIIYDRSDDFPQTKMSFFGTPPGMAVLVGRLSKKNDKIGFTILVNNLVRGAAGGSIENAEAFLDRYGDKI